MGHIESYFLGLVQQIQEELLRTVKSTIQDEIKKALAEKDDILSVDQTRKLFTPPISRSALRNYTASGKLQKHYVGRRTFYSRKEVTEAIMGMKKYKEIK